MTAPRSITESPNCLTTRIDYASAAGIARLLRQTDGQIFTGFGEHPGLYDDCTLDTLARLAARAAETLAANDGVVVLSGAGTSGRLAMLGAKAFNDLLASKGRPAAFRYLIAGGNAALMQAQEGAEDDPHAAQADLAAVTAGAGDVFFVGITCGYSAPYIAGQLEAMLDSAKGFSVLMGFNPVELSRTTPVENWPHHFKRTAVRTAESPLGALLNPVVGPEPVTGSTRMKSGTATKILIEVLFHAAVRLVEGTLAPGAVREAIRNDLNAYEAAVRETYYSLSDLAELIEAAGRTLRAKRHIYYLGLGCAEGGGPVHPNTGILGLVDASECPPTYGAGFEDVRGFISGGWRGMFPDGSVDLSSRGSNFRIGLDDLEQSVLPGLTAEDLVIGLCDAPSAAALLEKAVLRGATTAAICWRGKGLPAAITVDLSAPAHPYLGDALLEIQLKLTLNATTTGGHILAGKVYGNRMIDLRISNNKLFHRTVGIISDIMGVNAESARHALLKAVFETDELSERHEEATISACIEQAKLVDKVVPKALLIASGRFSVAQAAQALRQNPVVRQVLNSTLAS